MIHTQSYQNTSALFHEQSMIEVLAYSFSAYTEPVQTFTTHKVFLDILFEHPRTSETITLRTIAPAHLLCSSKDEIEATVHREIRNTLHFQTSGTL
ncbi:hypothetical protein SAMN05444008_110138 [Cnuella takakiae]|uniref:Uncharacterized protein n=1 Tax=Cnuella takakiae TaxID=1302690 RepID=A0A1M5D9Y2_9BACT|nr:hypothetical protein [Cnuella takakiae]OLY94053.1 hypothetical protein BUE76_20785 [Cnuella takakiae]SHF63784.1 hypothetical protein SAMN05444008_110138 [Cnuella takakiae]